MTPAKIKRYAKSNQAITHREACEILAAYPKSGWVAESNTWTPETPRILVVGLEGHWRCYELTVQAPLPDTPPKPRGSTPRSDSDRARAFKVGVHPNTFSRWRTSGDVTALERAGLPVTPRNITAYRGVVTLAQLLGVEASAVLSSLTIYFSHISSPSLSDDGDKRQSEVVTPPPGPASGNAS